MESDADREAENQSWWDRAVSAVADALNALVSAISDMWSAIRDAVAAALDAAVAFANDLIDACLAFVTALLNAYYDFLQFLVQELLGDIFPGLADGGELCGYRGVSGCIRGGSMAAVLSARCGATRGSLHSLCTWWTRSAASRPPWAEDRCTSGSRCGSRLLWSRCARTRRSEWPSIPSRS